ncbi:ABC transporter related protein [Thermofilum adornatum 1505]|jgi:energy-coupling factor transport system ATP-binding protein|uniref:ABC transporter related protein n=1 Tax=Thermofilum adornatum 1505 TaxID=697581 RepID=A0A3G1A5B1_9CREN|nr:ABC transporter ATP-binding protein [Thermofilum adornatum]AJB41123.1 ABC transporter related protein [Thermofilum adornatum 1505]
MSESEEKIIEIDNVYYEYPEGIQALRGVTNYVLRGEIVAIMGENGAGKTTLIKHFNGLLKPTRGRIKVKDKDTRETSVAELSRIVGIVFQNPDHQLFAETVFDEVAFPLRNFGFPEDAIENRVKWALNILELYQYRDNSPFMLSVGERKRLAIASVLAYDPEVIVLDEPTAGQDYLQKEKISEIIKLLKLMGKTIVLVTHDIEFVTMYVQRIIVMSQGKIIAEGPPHRVLTDYNVIRRGNLLPPQLVRISRALYGKSLLDRYDYLSVEDLSREIISKMREANGGTSSI